MLATHSWPQQCAAHHPRQNIRRWIHIDLSSARQQPSLVAWYPPPLHQNSNGRIATPAPPYNAAPSCISLCQPNANQRQEPRHQPRKSLRPCPQHQLKSAAVCNSQQNADPEPIEPGLYHLSHVRRNGPNAHMSSPRPNCLVNGNTISSYCACSLPRPNTMKQVFTINSPETIRIPVTAYPAARFESNHPAEASKPR